ncbi:MAG: aminopeptidase [Bacteroidia bacterium]|nr:aminopeptidase [Bacteroidia bacterium]
MEIRTELIRQLCAIPATSGDEGPMRDFILDYVKNNAASWKVQPVVHSGEGFQDCVALAFGKPRTAVFAHIDSIGFTVKYKNELVRIGGPVSTPGIELLGADSKGEVRGTLVANKNGTLHLNSNRMADPGTRLCFASDFREKRNSIQSAYLDNRLGVYVALELASTLENGLICFSCWEEHGGGTVGFLADFMTKKYQVYQALISDITWVTEGVKAGKGAAISLRDSGIPRKAFVDRILGIVQKSNISYQVEVEGAGGSDGTELQKSPFPIDWCFIGAPEKNVHSPNEEVHKSDIQSMLALYRLLMDTL